ncbi:MAG: hypothetical protein JW969_08480 [Spirochaetales bacterium]|nr:hypothetical protein [Spirochaetales bacterium]
MKKIYLLAVICLVFSCSGERLVLFSHKVFTDSIENYQWFIESVKKGANSLGYTFDSQIVGDDFETVVPQIIDGLKAEIIAFDPYVSLSSNRWITSYPQIFFISFVPAVIKPAPSNLLFISYNRKKAYRKAGEAAAILLGNPLIHQDTEDEVKLGMIAYSDSAAEREEIEAFREGFTLHADENLLEYREIQNLTDQNNIRNTYMILRGLKVRLFFLRAYNLNAALFDTMLQYNDFAILNNPYNSPVPKTNMLVTIVDDPVKALAESLKTGRHESQWDSEKIEIESTLQWNADTPLPDDLNKAFSSQ